VIVLSSPRDLEDVNAKRARVVEMSWRPEMCTRYCRILEAHPLMAPVQDNCKALDSVIKKKKVDSLV